MLLKKHRNELFEIISAVGLNPHTFEEKVTNAKYSLRASPPHIFKFEISHPSWKPDYYEVVSIPGFGKSLLRASEKAADWESVKTAFLEWAENLKSELILPDLWAEAAATAQLFAAPAAADEKFTDHELRELQSQLRAAEAKLTASGLPEAAIRELTAALREAAPKAETMTKKDWQNMVVGAVVSTLTGLALSADHVQTVYQILKATFSGWLLH